MRTASFQWLSLIAGTVRSGAKVIGSSSFGAEVEAAAVKNADDSIGVVLLNRAPEAKEVHVRVSGFRMDLTLPAEALTSLIITE